MNGYSTFSRVWSLTNRCSSVSYLIHSLGGVFLLSRDAVGVFYSLIQPGRRTLVGKGSYTSTEMQSVNSAAPAEWATGHSLGRGLTLQRRSRRIRQSQVTRPQNIRCEGVLHISREAVGVFYSPSRLGYRSLVAKVSYISTEMQSLYSAAQSSGRQHTRWEGALLLGRDVVGVFYSPSHRTLVGKESYSSAKMQSVNITAPANLDVYHHVVFI